MERKLLMLLTMVSLFSCATTQDLPTVEEVDIQRYQGVWFEIARLPNSFEMGLECVTANYSGLMNHGKAEGFNPDPRCPAY